MSSGGGIQMHETALTSQDATVRPPSRVHSNDIVVFSSHPCKNHGNSLGSSNVHHELSRQPDSPNTEFIPDSFNQHYQGDPNPSFLPIAPLSKEHFESQFLSALEPRPILSAIRPSSSCHDDKLTLPMGGMSTNRFEQPVCDRIGSMGEYDDDRKNENSIMASMGESGMTLLDHEHKRRLLLGQPAQSQSQQTRSSEDSSRPSSSSSPSALQFLTHLLQPETGNDISPYCQNFFVSSTNYWHSSHLDEFGFCCDIVGSERPTLQHLSDLADLGDSSSCVGSILEDEPSTRTFGMMRMTTVDYRTTAAAAGGGGSVAIGDQSTSMPTGSQDSSLWKGYYHQEASHPPQALLQQQHLQQPGPTPRQEQPFLSSKFASDQFLTVNMGRGSGLVDKCTFTGSGRAGDCVPDMAKSKDNITLLASTLCDDNTMDWKNVV
jgi:hypothetical protein